MSVATDITLIRMIEKKTLFLQFIDYLDQQEQGEAIPLSLYYSSVRSLIAAAPESEKRQLSETFDPDNLMQAGLLLELDKSRRIIVFQAFVVEMFRHFDRRRLRGLSSEQLEDLRRQLNDSLERLKQISLTPGDNTYEEVVALLFGRLQNTHGRIRQNVNSLQGQAERLSAIVDNADLQNRDQAFRVREALTEINRIYQRNVLPTLEFLNEREDIKHGKPALTAVAEIAQILTLSSLADVGQRALFAAGSIRSYARDIEMIRKTLERYVRQNQRQRHQYDCIEQLFGELKEAVEGTHDGKLNNKYVDRGHQAFRHAVYFRGLKSIRFEARLDWKDRHQSLLFDEHLRITLPKLREKELVSLARLSRQDQRRQKKAREQLQRMQAIRRLVDSLELPTHHANLHLFLHEILCERLEDYRLPDLLDSLSWLRARLRQPLCARFELKTLEHCGLRLNYYPLQVIQVMEAADA